MREDFERLDRLLAEAKPHVEALRIIEKEVLAITGDSDWGPGPSSDYVWEGWCGAKELMDAVGLKRMYPQRVPE